MTTPAPELDTAIAVLDRAGEAVLAQRRWDAELMRAACAWADLHPADALDAATVAGTYGDTALKVAGSYGPGVTEFAVAEFASRLGRSTTAGAAYLGQALVCRHLLPRLWDAVQAHRVDGWRARLVARMVLGKGLTPEAAGWVDRHVTPVAQSIGAATLERLVAEALARFMPDEAELAQAEAREQRRFEIHLDGRPGDDLTGTVDASGCFDLPDGLTIHDAVAEEKQRLRALGATAEPGPLSAQALLNLVVRGSDGASAQGTLDLVTVDGGRAAGPGERVETPETPAGRSSPRQRRRYLLHLHLSDAVLRTSMFPGRLRAGDGAVGRVEETRAPVSATAIRDWLTTAGIDGVAPHVTVLPVIDLAEAVHTEAYEVPRRLARQTALTHLACVFPWCGRAARRCDHDHVIPYDPTDPDTGGPTCSCNIAPLCRPHHRLKTHGHAATRWTLTPAGAGAWLWKSPHGAHYLRDHTGTRPLDGPLAHDTGPPDTGPPDTGPPDTGPPDTAPPDTGSPPGAGPARVCDTGPPRNDEQPHHDDTGAPAPAD
ncbi:HNH endonuclease signature motif containing protein [Nocardioides perillae]|uniref:HNH nuclease domain-containing protein n=1 Tax=Nocardioides perillae TaxID=1119534 RepID=A0A7Y9UV98_9ACTN|nr:HNH endonuclease signature motif containing protein [Nocardioides perillae]NYG56070.1 hypothetical protein [Nocardioides perillae]